MPKMQPMPGAENAGQMNIDEMQETAMNVISAVATIVTMPVEIFLRPEYGTRYFAAPVFFLSAMMMLFASAFFDVAAGISQMLPMGRPAAPVGAFGIGSFTALFFMASSVHGVRIWRRMIHPEREEISTFEGPPLPIYGWLPKGRDFWVVRIWFEPIFVIALAIVLSNFLIIQGSLKFYLEAAALFLAMKQYIAWYRSWAYVRNLLDMANMGPIIGRIVSSTATDEELDRVHLASLPRNMPEDMRRATVEHMARGFQTPKVPDEKPPETPNPEAGSAGLRFILQSLVAAAVICLGMAWFTGYRQHIRMAAQHLSAKRSPFQERNNNPAPLPPVAAPPVITAVASAQLGHLFGYWQGRGYFERRGMCTLHLEIRPAPDNRFAGFATLLCIPMRTPVYPDMRFRVPTPASAILSGAVTDGSIHLQTDKSIDAGTGCFMKSLTATPFGARQVAADWKDTPCSGGQMVLQRVNQ